LPVLAEFNTFDSEISSCKSLREHAIENISSASSRQLIYESIVIRLARAQEQFIEQIFLSYLTGEPTVDGDAVPSYVNPQDRNHARQLLTITGAKFLDWSTGADIRKRCQVFFGPDSPIDAGSIGIADSMAWLKSIRNQAAHDSVESRLGFIKVVEHILLIAPNPMPSAGEFLQMTPTSGPVRRREVLAFLLDKSREFAMVAAGHSGVAVAT
jgi:hypothetical protein